MYQNEASLKVISCVPIELRLFSWLCWQIFVV